MEPPILKQFAELTPSDFEEHPIWIGCHVADHDEEWYDETDEETFRPWLGERPVPKSDELLLVRADVRLGDGSAHTGFLTPSTSPSDISSSHPNIFLGERAYSFWSGILDTAEGDAAAFETEIGKDATQILPIDFTIKDELVTGGITVTVDRWQGRTMQYPRPGLWDQLVRVFWTGRS